MDGVDGLGLIDGIGQDGTVPTDEVLKQRLRVKWEVGDGGEGGGWKAGLVLGEGEEGLELVCPQLLRIIFAVARMVSHGGLRFVCVWSNSPAVVSRSQ